MPAGFVPLPLDGGGEIKCTVNQSRMRFMDIHEKEKDRLRELIRSKSLTVGKPVTLSSGRKSDFYFDGKMVTLDAEGAYLIAHLVLDALSDVEVDAIGGLTLGADPIAATVAAVSFEHGHPINGFIVRKASKEHGTSKQVEGGPLHPGCKVAIVEDVVTSGASAMQAIEAVEAIGARVAKVVAIVDRLQGAEERFADAGYRFQSLFTLDDFGITTV